MMILNRTKHQKKAIENMLRELAEKIEKNMVVYSCDKNLFYVFNWGSCIVPYTEAIASRSKRWPFNIASCYCT